jgi:hypothetical protein
MSRPSTPTANPQAESGNITRSGAELPEIRWGVSSRLIERAMAAAMATGRMMRATRERRASAPRAGVAKTIQAAATGARAAVSNLVSMANPRAAPAGFPGAVEVEVEDHAVGAVLGQADGGRPANARAAAGDECDPSVQAHRCLLSARVGPGIGP